MYSKSSGRLNEQSEENSYKNSTRLFNMNQSDNTNVEKDEYFSNPPNQTQQQKTNENDRVNGIFANVRLVDDPKHNEEQYWSTVVGNASYLEPSVPVGSQQELISRLRAGIQPTNLRGLVWQAISHSASLNLGNLYEQLKEEPTPYEKQIRRDVTRTYPHFDMFSKESGQRALERVLRAYSLYDTDVGYCQGLAFLVGPLLINMPEENTFCVFVRLMETYGMRTLFTLDMEGLHLRLFQFDVLLSELVPEVYRFLAAHGMHSQLYASQWFLTMFAYIFPLPLVFRIFDLMFAEGPIETVMRLALSLLKKSANKIMKLGEFEDIMDCLSKRLIEPYGDNFDLMIEESLVFHGSVTKVKLTSLEEKYSILKVLKNNNGETSCSQSNNDQTYTQKSSASLLTSPNKVNGSIKQSKGWFGTIHKFKRPKHPPVTIIPPLLENNNYSDPKLNDDITILHQQIEDLVSALTEVQRDNTKLGNELTRLKGHEEHPASNERSSLGRNSKRQVKHVYSCRTTSSTKSKSSHWHCELEQQLKAAKMRISDLESALTEHQRISYSSSSSLCSLTRSTSSNSSRSSASSSSSSSSVSSSSVSSPISPSYMISPPQPTYRDKADTLGPIEIDYFEPVSTRSHYSSTKEPIMLPSAYYRNNHSSNSQKTLSNKKKSSAGVYNRFISTISF